MRGRQAVRRFASIAILALALGARAQFAKAQPPLVTRVHGIATGIAACWRPPHEDDQVTVRVSFTREGAVIGEPRIVFVRSSGGRGRRRRACRFHAGGDTRLHAAQFLRSAWLGDRGPGSGHSLHRSQPGDHRRPALMNAARQTSSFAPALSAAPGRKCRLRLREFAIHLIFASRGDASGAGVATAWRRAEAQCLGA